jgi:hypothetical protein
MLIFSHKCGQLGNNLFAFAHLIANAKANDHSVINLAFEEYAQYFENTKQSLFCCYPQTITNIPANRLRFFLFIINKAVVKLMRASSFTKSFLHEVVVADLPEYQFHEGRYFDLNKPSFQKTTVTKKFTFLFGRFFRDYLNMEEYQESIREFFRPTKQIQEKVNHFLSLAKHDTECLVGVHIRRGDYEEFAGGKFFYSLNDYYRKMQEIHVSEDKKKISFVVCSNEPIDPSVFQGLRVFIGPGHLVEDLYILAGCDILMGPPSTYSRWASFYGKKPLAQIIHLEELVSTKQFVILPPEQLFDF